MNTLSLCSDTPCSPAPAQPIRVTIIEDDDGVRTILRDWLRAEPDFRFVSQFASAEAAIRQLPQQPPDVALLDIHLPGLNGIECLRRLKPALPSTQFVILTVYEDANYIFDAIAAGATGYLLKRTSRNALLTALREVHAGGSPMSSNIARKVVQSLQSGPPKGSTAEGLSPRENEVLELLARGFLYKEIADTIGISMPTVKTYIRRICEKLHVHSRAQAVALYANLPLRRS
ncbi:MAG TPA: response regulator transcription factor [Opitutaceae bacterium]|nr:response regulator transcription factor [Opitutaceae bacterium]